MFYAHPQEGDDVVLGDGLQEPGGARQRLEAGAACGEEGADDDDPGSGPSQSSYHQIPSDGVSEPAGNDNKKNKKNPVRTMTATVFPLHTCSTSTHLSLRTTPSMQAPNRTTLLRSGGTTFRKTPRRAEPPPTPLHLESVISALAAARHWKDTDEGGGEDGQDGSYGDGALGVLQVP